MGLTEIYGASSIGMALVTTAFLWKKKGPAQALGIGFTVLVLLLGVFLILLGLGLSGM